MHKKSLATRAETLVSWCLPEFCLNLYVQRKINIFKKMIKNRSLRSRERYSAWPTLESERGLLQELVGKVKGTEINRQKGYRWVLKEKHEYSGF